MAFNLSDALKSAMQESDNGLDTLVYLPLDQIDPDPVNFYSMDNLDDLAENIELLGLQQPLRVRPAEGGKYIVVSGHRRRAACLMIRDGGSDMFARGVPCIVEYGEASAAMRELRLIYANASTRVMTPAETAKQAERVEALLYELKEQGVEFPGRMRDHVAEACQVSRSKLARLHAIRSNLDIRLLDYFDTGEMAEETAYQLSRLPADIQEAVAEEAGARKAQNRPRYLPIASVVEEVNKTLDDYRKELRCSSHAGCPDCHHKKEKLLRSVFEQYYWNVCRGKCCRECGNRDSCSAACQEQKARAKLEKACEKEKEQEQEKKREAEQSVRRTQRKNEAKRLLPLIEQAGLSDDEALPGNYTWQPGTKIGKIRAWAAGEFGDDYFYNNEILVPGSLESLTVWADKLGCTLDFLAGRVPFPHLKTMAAAPVSDPDTRPGWQTGVPKEVGDYVIRFGISKEEVPQATEMRIKHWNGEMFVACGTGVPVQGTIYRWTKLPEV